MKIVVEPMVEPREKNPVGIQGRINGGILGRNYNGVLRAILRGISV